MQVYSEAQPMSETRAPYYQRFRSHVDDPGAVLDSLEEAIRVRWTALQHARRCAREYDPESASGRFAVSYAEGCKGELKLLLCLRRAGFSDRQWQVEL